MMKTIAFYLLDPRKNLVGDINNLYDYFHKKIVEIGHKKRNGFSIVPKEEMITLNQGHGSLTYFINNYSGDLSSLCILLDSKSDKNRGSFEIAQLIVCFPEISFYFLQTVDSFVKNLKTNHGLEIPDNVIFNKSLNIAFDDIAMLNSDSQLFDCSNIRSVLCQAFHKQWNFPDNFKSIRDSRKSHYAIVVDSDVHQCQLSAYSLFSCGYRCATISTVSSLSKLKENAELIIRDFDLQLQDLTGDGPEPPYPVQYIRGFQDIKDENKSNIIKWIADLYNDQNVYWKNGDKEKMYYLSYKFEKTEFTDYPQEFKSGSSFLQLRGWSKPLAGVYYPFFKHINETKKRFDDSRPYSSSGQTTLRGDGNHYTIKIYEDAINMVVRAEKYYKEGNYIVAAIVAQSAVEFLNRYYRGLSLRAYSVQALAQNAIAMSVQGSNEQELAEDARIRVDEIKQMVEYLYDKDETNCNTNTLNQIFTDCRLFCKDKEHFMAEDVFISEMAHKNDGGSTAELLKEGYELITRLFRKHS